MYICIYMCVFDWGRLCCRRRCCWRFVLERCECMYVCMQTFVPSSLLYIHPPSRQANHPPTFYFHPYSFLREPQDFCKHPPVLPLAVCASVWVCMCSAAPPGHPHLYMLMKVNTYKRKPNTGHALAHSLAHSLVPVCMQPARLACCSKELITNGGNFKGELAILDIYTVNLSKYENNWVAPTKHPLSCLSSRRLFWELPATFVFVVSKAGAVLLWASDDRSN